MTRDTAAHPSRLGPVGSFVATREVLAFFGLTIAFSWAAWVPGAIGIVDYGPFVFPAVVVGGFGPLLAAAFVTWLVGDSVRAWASQVLRWRVRPRWYVVAVGLPIAVVALVSVVTVAIGYSFEGPEILAQVPLFVLPLIFVLNMVTVFLVGGGQEELGWRGFALPRLLERFDAVTASVLIGLVWASWHLPLFALEGSGQYGSSFAPYVVSLLGLSVLFTWLYRSTGRSVLLAMILHASYNSSTLLLPGVQTVTGELHWVFAGVVCLFALGVFVVYGRSLRSGDADGPETDVESPPQAT
ncbi:CPBP family intramembrane metalloprotease [Halorubellus sp. JP-L1]|uniref:CPBP family intramembrane glutamic endopeptidase n=1 Tax=Halorubellus sp. JP-L1 TaxID=2715753 RepID=UPI001408FBB0|nr:type II CAAX endopeptidase family protein [Halorubellus sp. JP-L1]NHN42376.1 CPBP family intramembrane metalloprotease [Halorubellus sp. JP-L1]